MTGVCDRFWSGTNDVVDFTGLSCQNPFVLEKTIWAVACVLWLLLVVKHVKAISLQKRKLERIGAARGTKWYSFKPLRILLPSLVLTIPTIAIVCLMRVVTDDSIGTDGAVTFLYCFGVFVSFLLRSSTLDQIMIAITTGITLNPENRRFLHKLRLTYLGMNVWYVGTGAGPLIASVFIDSASSVEARTKAVKMRTYLLLFRNFGAIVYYLFLAVYCTLWLRFARKLTSIVSDSNNGVKTAPSSSGGPASSSVGVEFPKAQSSTADGGSSNTNTGIGAKRPTSPGRSTKGKSRLQRTLANLESNAVESRSACVKATALFCIFSLPWLWPYASVMYAVTSCIMGGSSHFVNSYIDPEENQRLGSVYVGKQATAGIKRIMPFSGDKGSSQKSQASVTPSERGSATNTASDDKAATQGASQA